MAIGTWNKKSRLNFESACNLAYTSLLKTQPICNPLPRDRCIWDWSYKITIAYTTKISQQAYTILKRKKKKGDV